MEISLLRQSAVEQYEYTNEYVLYELIYSSSCTTVRVYSYQKPVPYAVPQQIPYQVMLKLAIGDVQALCGGSLISPSIVLSSVQCLLNITTGDVGSKAVWSALTVVAGNNDSSGGGAFAQSSNVVRTNVFIQRLLLFILLPVLEYASFSVMSELQSKVLVHPKYNSSSFQNDIALLTLSTPFTLNQYVNVVPLPAGNSSFDGQICKVSCWGRTSEGDNKCLNFDQRTEIKSVVISAQEAASRVLCSMHRC